MQANELRRAFVDFFAERDHEVVASASLIPHDPSLLFTVAGMVPFKPYFVGEEPAPWPRAVSVQKCVRAGGKHNDLDEIGRTSRHLSFFEMLGNFSFGDYFKPEAISLAWEFITETLGLDPQRLWMTVHTSDDEAAKYWTEEIGVDPSRVQRLDEDNFWRMGDLGPCGPSSEIFWDKGPEFGADGGPAHGGEDRFIEIWNLVFMQFDQLPDGTQAPLPKPSIDTGAGLERILSVLQGVESVWELDEIRALIALAEELSGTAYGAGEESDVSLRILAEHARTAVFLVSDGIFPSNEDRGYVLRRIIRRAVRHAYLLGVETPVMGRMAAKVIEIMSPDYPELAQGAQSIAEVIEREEKGFRETLRSGNAILKEALAELPTGGQLSGSIAFQLHDTYGFPLEVTQEVARDAGVSVDTAGFEAEMALQRDRARASRKGASIEAATSSLNDLLDSHGPTTFVGRDVDDAVGTVLSVDEAGVVVDITPFYAESGGQIGDTGVIEWDSFSLPVVDTVYGAPGIVLHRIAEGATELPDVGTEVNLRIDSARRSGIRRHHTATHLLHWALRDQLGEHVKQQGSYVGPDRLRFDFSHYDGLTPDEIISIEDQVNAEILTASPVRHYETTKTEALAAGAIAFFGDKYGDTVRVLEAGSVSVELCGGTHVTSLGEIGPIKIVSESSIGSNIRRLEAVAGVGPIERLRDAERQLDAAASELGVGAEDLLSAIAKRVADNKSLTAELKAVRAESARSAAGDLTSVAVDGVIVAQVEISSRDEIRDMATSLRDQPGIRAVVLAGAPGGKGVAFVAAVDPDSGIHAGELISDAVSHVGGGGGKGEHLATAGGRDAEAIPAALDMVRVALGLPT